MFNINSTFRLGLVGALAVTVAACDDEIVTNLIDESVAEIAASNADFSTLVTALQAANLVATLDGEGPFTVFAPTDAAFEALPEGVLDELLADTDLLESVLLYHVVAGSVFEADVVGLTSATTLNGASLSIEVDGSMVMIDGATVTQTDIEASNGRGPRDRSGSSARSGVRRRAAGGGGRALHAARSGRRSRPDGRPQG